LLRRGFSRLNESRKIDRRLPCCRTAPIMPRMSRRMRVLLSAFACEPHKGSEPEVGWQWAMQMARFHDVTVLTQSKNRAGIESALKSLGGKRPEPHFIYFDLPKWLQRLRKYSLGLRVLLCAVAKMGP